jgi:hypothetical protein
MGAQVYNYGLDFGVTMINLKAFLKRGKIYGGIGGNGLTTIKS